MPHQNPAARCQSHQDLFGGTAGWDAKYWTSSDDRVRGGKSQSYLECPRDSQDERSAAAVFRGDLDIKTLGGAGFASQRTTDDLSWDLSSTDGILLRLGKSDGKKYTFTLKDESLPKRPDGREQSTVSWEYDFAGKDGNDLFVPWADFKPTYRGKPKSDADPLDLKNVKRISIMMRSFFGEQEGSFRLEIKSISAAKQSTHDLKRLATESSAAYPEKAPYKAPKPTWKDWVCGVLWR
ncbi:putative NADH:ubiquinone oxidoreductase intermediate-associated protein 30 domain-containing protein [Seiridium unicorne]|uniref:NADH:ubiquinone oxidoreductase intermediate-associated protein 30 domain-containing protein n=1 Tax=Seiridium unicorne TaxID=138068 RepID=A0ABR2V0S3_9PEZI